MTKSDACWRFFRAAKVDNLRQMLAKVEDSRPTLVQIEDFEGLKRLMIYDQRWWKSKNPAGCKNWHFMTKSKKDQRLTVNINVDQWFWSAAKLDNSQPILVKDKDTWELQNSTIHNHQWCMSKVPKYCKDWRFTTNVVTSGANWSLER